LLPSGGGALPDTAPATAPYSPAQIRQAYGFNNITFNNGTVAGDGRGQTIAIIDAYDDPNIAGDLHAFDSHFGLLDPNLSVFKQNVNGQLPTTDPSGGWELEESLDVEWAHAIAPGANILVVEAIDTNESNLFWAVQWAANQPGVSVVSMSFGLPEYASQTSLDSHFTTPAGHQGVTFVAASGDQGTVSYPAASPNVLAVGGTSLTLDSSGNYVSETAWSSSGGGLSSFEAKPGYQKNVQASGQRGSPDVAYNAAPSTGYWLYDSFSQNPWLIADGTSAGASQWAALIAIANQGRALQGLGTLDGPSQTLPMLYAMPSSSFHDITSGSNAGFSAGPGYDLVTGLGSPYADRVVAALVQGSLSPSGSSSSGSGQPPSSTSPPAAPVPSDVVAADAFFVVQGIKTGNLALIFQRFLNFEIVFWTSSPSIRPQVELDFIEHFISYWL
jgi:subtilase family serine protease